MSLAPLSLDREKNQGKHQHVRFDEATIAEHDKERGTRMVIDEPDTPFARSPLMSESEDDSVHTRASARFALDGASEVSGRSEDEHAVFKAKRKAHYNEFKVAKASSATSDEDLTPKSETQSKKH